VSKLEIILCGDELMNTVQQSIGNPARKLWHIVVDLGYEGGDNESCQDGVKKMLSALSPLTENGSGVKQVLIMRLPEKD
jgi:hypothetical protein